MGDIMNSEAVRARNARKRAKLKAHKQGPRTTETTEQMYMFEFGVKGIKAGFPEDAEDAGFEDPELPTWAFTEDFLEYSVQGPAELYLDLDGLKWRVKEEVECLYGFNLWDMDVRLLNVFKL